jgi:hypothetical protein
MSRAAFSESQFLAQGRRRCSEIQFDHFGSSGYYHRVNYNLDLLLSKALLLSGAAVGF